MEQQIRCKIRFDLSEDRRGRVYSYTKLYLIVLSQENSPERGNLRGKPFSLHQNSIIFSFLVKSFYKKFPYFFLFCSDKTIKDSFVYEYTRPSEPIRCDYIITHCSIDRTIVLVIHPSVIRTGPIAISRVRATLSIIVFAQKLKKVRCYGRTDRLTE